MTGGREGDDMKVFFERSGGFMGVPRQVSIDSDSNSPDTKEKLTRLIESSRFFDMPPRIDATGHPDSFQYKIIVEEGERKHSVTLDEASMPNELKPLVKYLMGKM